MEEKEEAIEALDRTVRRTELVVARTVEKVKREEEGEWWRWNWRRRRWRRGW